jgi:hypothetical protein
MPSKFLVKHAKRSENFKRLFPKFDLTGNKLIHPTAVLEDPNGEFFILKMNGLQPLSATDFFVLWH